jgi:hypothetical protein
MFKLHSLVGSLSTWCQRSTSDILLSGCSKDWLDAHRLSVIDGAMAMNQIGVTPLLTI